MAKDIIMTRWFILFIYSIIAMKAQVRSDIKIPITILESAIPKGAVCLDGSAPAYSYVAGFGSGSDRWIMYLKGGGWCNDFSDCYQRSLTPYGSSRYFNKSDETVDFKTILDSNCTSNPDFCNWHRVYIHYCDGSSFMSDIMDSKSNLSFRGGRIFSVMMEEMLAKGMRKAKQAILIGSSAGGLATMLNCDRFAELLPRDSHAKCISDSGFFLHAKGLTGEKSRENYFAGVIKTHGILQAVGDWYYDRSTFREIDTKHDTPQNCSETICGSLNKISVAFPLSSHNGLSCLLSTFLFLLIVV